MMKYIFMILSLIGSNLWAQKQSIKRKIMMGDSSVVINQYINSSQNILFINVHEDEQTSIEAVHSYSSKTEVNFAHLQHNGTRRIEFSIKRKTYSVDPNRIYTAKGRRSTLKDGGKYSWRAGRTTRKLAQSIIDLIEPGMIVIAMHNNTDVNYSIESYLPGGDEAANTKDVYINKNWDPDDFIYTTEESYFKGLSAYGVNVILQDNENCVNDGSLSVYCGQNGVPYINIEAQKGHLEEQIQLIGVVMDFLNANSSR